MSDVDDPPLARGHGRVVFRSLMAASTTCLAALLAAGLWVFGQAQYVQDYCHTRVHPPLTSPPEALSGRPAYWRDPVTIACEFEGFPTVHTTDPAPLLGALLLAGAVAAVALIAFRWARATTSAHVEVGSR